MATKTYKMSDDTAAKLAALMEQMKKEDASVSWDVCFDSLVRAYEGQRAAAETGRQANERDFRTIINRAIDMYNASLASIDTAKDSARAEAEKEIHIANTAAAALAEENEELKKKLEGYEAAKAAAVRADALQRANDELKHRHEAEMGMLKQTHAVEIREAVAAEREKYATQAGKAETLQKEIENLKHQHKAEIAMIKQTAAAEMREAIAWEREKHAKQLVDLKQESGPKKTTHAHARKTTRLAKAVRKKNNCRLIDGMGYAKNSSRYIGALHYF